MSLGAPSLISPTNPGRILEEFTNNTLFTSAELVRDLSSSFVNIQAFKTLYVSITSDIELTIQALFSNDGGAHSYYSDPIPIPADAVNTSVIGFDVLASSVTFRIANSTPDDSTIFHSSVYATRALSSPSSGGGGSGLTQLGFYSTRAQNAGTNSFGSGVTWRTAASLSNPWYYESNSPGPAGGLTELTGGSYRNDTPNEMVFRVSVQINAQYPLIFRYLVDGVPGVPTLADNNVNTAPVYFETHYFVLTLPAGSTVSYDFSLQNGYSARTCFIYIAHLSLLQIK